jgi:LysR family transcriptional regulator for bpeEF and oprC
MRPRLAVSSFELGARAAVSGIGIVRAPISPVKRYLETKELVRLLAEWSEPDAEVFAVTPPGGASVPKTRVFLDVLIARYAAREQSADAQGRSQRRRP